MAVVILSLKLSLFVKKFTCAMGKNTFATAYTCQASSCDLFAVTQLEESLLPKYYFV